MGNRSRKTNRTDNLSRPQQRILFHLVECAQSSDEEEWKFFYSPVFGQIEAIHPCRRKTIDGNITLDALRQWNDGELIEMIGWRRDTPAGRQEPPPTIGFVLRERALRYYVDHRYPGFLKPLMGLTRRILPSVRA